MNSQSLMWCDDSLSSDSFIFAVEEAERAALCLAAIECTPSGESCLNPSPVSSPSLLRKHVSTSSLINLSGSSSSLEVEFLPETVYISSSCSDSVEMLSPASSSEDITSVNPQPSCQCGKNVIEENCIWTAINNWEGNDCSLICDGCFFDVPNQMGHACLSYDLDPLDRDEFLNDRTWNTVLNSHNFMQIFNEYLKNHENCEEYAIVIFECALRNLLRRKVAEVRDKLITKDIKTGREFREEE